MWVKGVTIETGSGYYDAKISAAYVQLPLSAAYKLAISDEFALLINMGPYFAYGIGGKVKEGIYKEDTFNDEWMKKFDFGLLLGATLEWKKLCLGMGSEVGLINVMQSGNTKARNTNFVVSVGYKL